MIDHAHRRRPEVWLYCIAMFGPAFLMGSYVAWPDGVAVHLKWVFIAQGVWLLLGAGYCTLFNTTNEFQIRPTFLKLMAGFLMNCLLQGLLHLSVAIIVFFMMAGV